MSSGRKYTWLWVLGGLGAAYLLGRAVVKSERYKAMMFDADQEHARRIRVLYDAATPQARQEIDDFYRDIGQPRPF